MVACDRDSHTPPHPQSGRLFCADRCLHFEHTVANKLLGVPVFSFSEYGMSKTGLDFVRPFGGQS